MSVNTNVLILGHSFTRRLQKWCVDNHRINLNLDSNTFQVFWHGIGGGNILFPHHPKCLWSEAHLVSDLDANIVFLDIGSNDLCDSSILPEDLVQQLLDFGHYLISLGCTRVIFSEILHRRYSDTYNWKVDCTNNMLFSESKQVPNFIFWAHSRNNYNKRFLTDYVAPDGIHIDTVRGMPRYYSSVRGAIIYAARSY